MESRNEQDIAEVTVHEVAYPGKGVARHEGCVVFIDKTLTGEKVKIEFTHAARNFSEAKLLEVIEASPHRIEPACKYSAVCQGCCYQHVDYTEEVKLKQAQFASLLQRLGRVKSPEVLQSPTPCPTPMGYRNKIGMHVAGTGADRRVGYFAADNRSIIDIDCCPLARPEINKRLSELRSDPAFINSLETTHTINMRYTERDGVVQWMTKMPMNERVNADHDEPMLTETTFAGDVRLPRDSFFQVNALVAGMLVKACAELVQQIKPQSVIDLYCGVGVFALAAAKVGVPSVYGIDYDPMCILAAKENARLLNFANAAFDTLTAGKAIRHALGRVSPQTTTLIVDPPRRGLEKNIIQTIADARPANMIYVSCAPDTLARDVAMLGAAGYTLRSTRIFDMFPRTPYFESLSWLTASS